MNYHPMSEPQYDAMMDKFEAGVTGQEVVFPCDVDHEDHLHVLRIGDLGDGLAGRVGVLAHAGGSDSVRIFIAASEARVLAATLLTVADELDGEAPLLWLSPDKPALAGDPNGLEIIFPEGYEEGFEPGEEPDFDQN